MSDPQKESLEDAKKETNAQPKRTRIAKRETQKEMDLVERIEKKELFFTEKDLERILGNLATLKEGVYPEILHGSVENQHQKQFPSVCLIGLGRCGSNIALDVASLVHKARAYYLDNQDNSNPSPKEQRPISWLRKQLHFNPDASKSSVFLIEPLVMLGDLDKDIEGRVKCSALTDSSDFLKQYNKLKVMDLSEIHAGGAGNAPILGQYLAKIILNKDSDDFSYSDWKLIHSYLIDSCGIKANQSRLFFYIFSAGGGTGSGMASEFGLAQQYSYMNKTLDSRYGSDEENHSFIFEPIFTSGICILPNISADKYRMSEALHINAGRLLSKYLSEEWHFSYNHDSNGGTLDEKIRIRPWNAMMLISNDIMRYAEQSEGDQMQNVDVNTMEKYANQYVSQQIFNILTAQAVTSDYDENYFRKAGIDLAETIRLDANDLFMSLAGPVAVAYAETMVELNSANNSDKFKVFEREPSKFDIDDLFFRSIDLPHFNKETQAIEGISLLPIESTKYINALNEYKQNGFDATKLNDLAFFKNCSSIVSIISLPKDYKLSYMDLNRLKGHINALFPNTTLKRYALVIGASANLSLTTLVAKSPCLSDDFLTLIVAFIKRCFAKDLYKFDDTIDDLILQLIRSDDFDDSVLDNYLNEFENPAKILDTNWFAIKPMYEKKYHELIREPEKFVSIDEIRLQRDNIKNAIKYLREIYRHRISKTKVVSLN